jgi:hypothetical protein
MQQPHAKAKEEVIAAASRIVVGTFGAEKRAG